MKKTPTLNDLKGLAVRHTHIVDRDKVRYRVYRSSTEYIAVIAENALTAMKLSGISTPYKVIRDLIDINTPLNAERMRPHEASERVEFSIAKREDVPESNFAYREPKGLEEFFQPLSLGQLSENKTGPYKVMGSAEILEKIHVDPMEYARATRSEDAERMHAQSTYDPQPSAEAAPQEVAAPEPEAERMLADEPEIIEAEAADMSAEEAVAEEPSADAELPPDEIARLLAEPRS